MTSHPQNKDDYRQNHGVPGVVYILENPGLRAGLLKIGCSRRSGAVRAEALNKDASTGTPGLFSCVFECSTLDCGRAEEFVHEIFHEKRRGKFGKNKSGKWGQEFFEIDLAEAKKTITQVCKSVDDSNRKSGSNQKKTSGPTTSAIETSEAVPAETIVNENPGNPYSLKSKLAETNAAKSGVLGKLSIAIVALIAILIFSNSGDRKRTAQVDEPIAPQEVLSAGHREAMSANVRSLLQRGLADTAATRTAFREVADEAAWLKEMSRRLAKRMPDESERLEFLTTLHWEASRAGVDPQLMLGLIQVVSDFQKYAVSPDGARGYTKVMPFWVKAIGTPDHNLFQLRTNLRYGALILRHYIDIEKGDHYRALGRYDGSLGRPEFPNLVVGAWKKHWDYTQTTNKADDEEGVRGVESGSNVASFDCNNAKSSTEMMICNDAELSRLDYELSVAYAQAKIAATDQKAFKQQAEAAWKWREENCVTKICLVSWYANRKAILQSLYEPPTVTKLTEAQFNKQYRCPESYSTEAERIKEMSDMLDWYMAHNKDVGVKGIATFRSKILADHGCYTRPK